MDNLYSLTAGELLSLLDKKSIKPEEIIESVYSRAQSVDKKIKGYICLRNNPIISNILGILLIDGCYKVYLDNKDVQDIINEYLPNKEGRKNVMKCKAKLVDAKFEEYAQL